MDLAPPSRIFISDSEPSTFTGMLMVDVYIWICDSGLLEIKQECWLVLSKFLLRTQYRFVRFCKGVQYSHLSSPKPPLCLATSSVTSMKTTRSGLKSGFYETFP